MSKVIMTLSVDPQIKELAIETASVDRRTLSALLLMLIEEHCPKIKARKGLQLNQLNQQAS